MPQKLKVSLDEQETLYYIYPKASGYPCEIYSCTPSCKKRIRKYAEQFPDEVKIVKEDQISVFAEAPMEWFSFRPPRHRNMTEEQKLAARERLASMRERKDKKE